MFKKFILVCILVVFLAPVSDARTIGGVNLDETMKVADTDLLLNGGGIRKKFFLDIYVAGLYLTKKNSDYMDIINKDESMAIKIEIVSKLITSERFQEATLAGFERTTNGQTDRIKKEIEASMKVFDQKFNVGDVFDIVYIKGVGVKFSKNGEFIATVPGMEFKKALFGIWIIDKPSHKNEKLRLGMLGMK